MKIAIATKGELVCDHFGHCERFDIYDIKDGIMEDMQTIPCPAHEPCKLPSFLKELGVNVIIAGGMGSRAVEQLDTIGIEAYLGVSGTALRALSRYIEGKLERGTSTCTGGDGDGCGH